MALIAALALPVMLGFVGLAAEAGTWLLTQRILQGVADAAAYSAGIAYSAGNTQGYATEGLDVAAQNGFADGVSNTSVSVTIPPQDGRFSCANAAATCDNYLEASVTQTQATLIARLFGLPSVAINAHAVVSLSVPGNDCVLALSPTKSSAVLLNGTPYVNLSCGLAIDSSSASALLMNGGTLKATSASIVGNALINTGTFSTPDTQLHAPAVADPYANVNSPPFSGCTYPSGVTVNATSGSFTLNPGVYCGPILLNGSGFTVNLSPGTYVLDRASLVVNGSPTLTSNGQGVSFVFSSSTGSNVGTLTVNGSPLLNLTAENSGPTTGFLFYQDRNASPLGNDVFNGASGSRLNGAIYFPKQALTYNGAPQQGSGCTQIIAQSITFNGTPTLALDDCDEVGVKPIGSRPGQLVE